MKYDTSNLGRYNISGTSCIVATAYRFTTHLVFRFSSCITNDNWCQISFMIEICHQYCVSIVNLVDYWKNYFFL